ncbi:hypothetical protein WJX73_000430 [Symbiochloris irregularis]|uniref:MARVEL domain-containing protein n=1 Tax=Symbiochloris irregularis TaxID=706552 RepID=A0AAW1PE60_9CHLO
MSSTTTVDDPALSSGAMGPGKRGANRQRLQGKGKVFLYALTLFLLMAAIAMAVAPVSGYKKEPTRVPQYILVKDVQHAGLVVTGFTVAFLLLSALIGVFYLLIIICSAVTRRPSPPGLSITAVVVGFFNCAWSIACYIVLAVGVAKETRQELDGASFVSWPDWCFFLAFFSGVFWLIIAGLAKTAVLRRSRSANRHFRNSDPHMVSNMAYNGDHGGVANGSTGATPTTPATV